MYTFLGLIFLDSKSSLLDWYYGLGDAVTTRRASVRTVNC